MVKKILLFLSFLFPGITLLLYRKKIGYFLFIPFYLLLLFFSNYIIVDILLPYIFLINFIISLIYSLVVRKALNFNLTIKILIVTSLVASTIYYYQNKKIFYVVGTDNIYPNSSTKEIVSIEQIDSNSQFSRGDLIFSVDPLNAQKTTFWRIIGLPNDSIKIISDTIFVNGQKIKKEVVKNPLRDPTKEGYAIRENYNNKSYLIFEDFIFNNEIHPKNITFNRVTENNFFVLADNRNKEYDSRDFGGLPKSYILGKPKLIVYSSKIRRIGKKID